MSRALRLPASLLLAICSASVSGQGWPPEIKNLKVLPADTTAEQVIGQMRNFTFALGVRCQYCHVGEEGQQLSQFDFAADEKETKVRAREMIRMTQAINGQYLSKLEGERHGLDVGCVTCHRGAARPEPLDQVLTRIVVDEGIDAALAKYGQLRKEFYGSGTFDFGEGSLARAAEALLEKERTGDAVRLLELNLEHHADSQWTAGTLAGAYEKLDRKADALAVWKRLLRACRGIRTYCNRSSVWKRPIARFQVTNSRSVPIPVSHDRGLAGSEGVSCFRGSDPVNRPPGSDPVSRPPGSDPQTNRCRTGSERFGSLHQKGLGEGPCVAQGLRISSISCGATAKSRARACSRWRLAPRESPRS